MKEPIDARVCPSCGSRRTLITTSRINPNDGYLIRYRECERCKVRFRTYEIRDAEWKRLNRLMDDFLEMNSRIKERLDKG